MSNRAIFALMAVLGLAAIAGLYVMVRPSGDDAEVTTTKASGSAVPDGFAGSGHGPQGGKPLDPSLPSVGSSGRELPDKVKEYAANGAIIRDHRSGTRAPFEPNGTPAPGNDRKLPSTLTKSIADRVRDVMHDCVKSLPDGARGEKPRLEGSINIAIKANQVSINKTDINLRDVNGDAAETTRRCIVDRAMTITQAAGDEPDLASYDINLSFVLI